MRLVLDAEAVNALLNPRHPAEREVRLAMEAARRRWTLGADQRDREHPCTNHMPEALFLFERGPLALVAEAGLNPRPLGYEPYDAHLCRYGLSRATALISANLRRKAVLSLLRLACLRLSR